MKIKGLKGQRRFALDLPFGLWCRSKMQQMEFRMSGQLREQISAAMKVALKEQQKTRLSTLRLISAAIKDREIAGRSVNGSEGVGDNEVLEILSKMIKQRRESASTYEEAGRLELAQQENDEMDVISDFMPKQLNEEEVRQVCETVVDELGAEGLKDMGRTMGALKDRFAGQMDFGKAGRIVKELLG